MTNQCILTIGVHHIIERICAMGNLNTNYAYRIIPSLSKYCCWRFARLVRFQNDFSDESIKHDCLNFPSCSPDDYPFIFLESPKYRKKYKSYRYGKDITWSGCPYCHAEFKLIKVFPQKKYRGYEDEQGINWRIDI